MQEMQETWVWSLGQEDPLEKEMATYSSILAEEIIWTEEPEGYSLWGLKRGRQDFVTKQQQKQQLSYKIFISPSWITDLLWWRGLHHSMKLWSMPFRAMQDGLVIVKSFDKIWFMGEVNGNPLQYSCLKAPWTVWKGKNFKF